MIVKLFAFILLPLTILISCGGEPESSASDESKKNETVSDNPTYADRDFGDLLVELESNVGWDAVTTGWRSRREAWAHECFSVKDVAAKADLLIEFESYLEWSAVDPLWAKRREAWIGDLRSSSNDKDLGKYLAELEGYIIWDAVSPDWVDKREFWLKDCENLGKGEW